MSTSESASPTLISEAYRKLQQELHRNPNYGVASVHYAQLVADIVVAQRATELLDYGAGKGRLGQALKQLLPTPLAIHHYDPAIPEWSAQPRPCRLVACIDVLEHIEPEYLGNVLDELKRVVTGHGVFTVATGPARKILSDGRNAHLIQKPASWWLPLFMERFELVVFNRVDGGFWILVEALNRQS
jgi:hypothetical protein